MTFEKVSLVMDCLCMHVHLLFGSRGVITLYALIFTYLLMNRVGTVLPFSVFFGFRVFALFIRVLGRVFGPDLLREKSLYQMLGKNQGNIDNILIYSYYINGQYNQE